MPFSVAPQAVEAQGVESMLVVLWAAVQPPTRLDGLKSRALRAGAPTQRHLYVTRWRALEPQPAASEPAAGDGLPTQAAELVLSCGASVPDCCEHGGSASRRAAPSSIFPK